MKETKQAAESENTSASRLNLLSQKAIQSVITQASGDEKIVLNQLAEQAASKMSGGNSKEIIQSLSLVIKYLRDIAASGKKVTPSPAKPVASVFG